MPNAEFSYGQGLTMRFITDAPRPYAATMGYAHISFSYTSNTANLSDNLIYLCPIFPSVGITAAVKHAHNNYLILEYGSVKARIPGLL